MPRPLFTLSPRLATCGALVRAGSPLIDVGTDHAYLPIWLLRTGAVPRAVCCDINPGPLRSAEHHARQYHTEDRLRLVRLLLVPPTTPLVKITFLFPFSAEKA